MKLPKSILIITAFILQFSASAQIVMNNLPSSLRALSVVSDNSGNLWFAAHASNGAGAGVVKYDGTSFIIYNTSNSGLSDDYVGSVYIDSNGDLIAGSSVVDRFDGSTWTNYTPPNASNHIVSVDESSNGDLWMASWTQDCGAMNLSTSTFTIYDSGNSLFPPFMWASQCVHVDVNDHVWVGTQNAGLYEYDGANWVQYNYASTGLPVDYVNSVDSDANGNVWMAFKYGGLGKFDGSSWTVYNVANSGLQTDFIFDVMCMNNKIYMTSQGRLIVFDGINNWIEYNSSNSVLNDNDSLNLTFDSSTQTLWMSSGYADRFYSMQVVTGIESSDFSSHFKIYPNPTSDLLTITSDYAHTSSITVMDVSGKSVYSELDVRYPMQLNLNGLVKGIYFLEVRSETGIVYREKVIRN